MCVDFHACKDSHLFCKRSCQEGNLRLSTLRRGCYYLTLRRHEGPHHICTKPNTEKYLHAQSFSHLGAKRHRSFVFPPPQHTHKEKSLATARCFLLLSWVPLHPLCRAVMSSRPLKSCWGQIEMEKVELLVLNLKWLLLPVLKQPSDLRSRLSWTAAIV